MNKIREFYIYLFQNASELSFNVDWEEYIFEENRKIDIAKKDEYLKIIKKFLELFQEDL